MLWAGWIKVKRRNYLEFETAVRKYSAERHSRGFSSWGQFVAMLFCQLGHAKSLREICGGLAASEGKLRHLGLPAAPARSTLAYANEHRPWQLHYRVMSPAVDDLGHQPRHHLTKTRKRFFRLSQDSLATPLGPALVTNSLCPGQERRTVTPKGVHSIGRCNTI